MKIRLICDQCNKQFEKLKSKLRKSQKKVFCCKQCYYDNKHNPEGYIVNGYRCFWINNKNIYEHRSVMENFLGRSLNSKEIIHHINGDTLDNRLENLLVMTQNKHMSLHHKNKTVSTETRAKISKALKGHCMSEKTRVAFDKHRRKPKSSETKKKISDSEKATKALKNRHLT